MKVFAHLGTVVGVRQRCIFLAFYAEYAEEVNLTAVMGTYCVGIEFFAGRTEVVTG